MKAESMIAVRPDRTAGTFVGGFLALAAMAALLLATAAPAAAGAVRFESVPGSTVKRVILTPRAVERLGIETGEVSKQRIVRKQMFGGQVILPQKMLAKPEQAGSSSGGFGQLISHAAPKEAPSVPGSSTGGKAWVQVVLSQPEWDRVAQDKPARILPLATRDKLASELLALPSGYPPREDARRSMLRLYYVVPSEDHGLVVNDRMRVELRLSGSNEKRKVMPYSALFYDDKGDTWAYINPKPLVFVRWSVEVERIVGDLAVLADGPPVGTRVVTVGVPLLYGAEVVYQR